MRVRFAVPPEVAFDYLVDPRNRPEWQSSLVAVEGVTGDPRVGQRWVDVTKPRLRPAMETVVLDRPERWTETGTWHGFSAELTLEFHEAGHECDVAVTMGLSGRGAARPVAAALTLVSPYAVRSDLRRAARILADRHH